MLSLLVLYYLNNEHYFIIQQLSTIYSEKISCSRLLKSYHQDLKCVAYTRIPSLNKYKSFIFISHIKISSFIIYKSLYHIHRYLLLSLYKSLYHIHRYHLLSYTNLYIVYTDILLDCVDLETLIFLAKQAGVLTEAWQLLMVQLLAQTQD